MLDRLDFATRTRSGNLLLRLLRDFGRDHVLGYLLAAIFLGLIALSNVSVAWLLRPVLNGMVTAEKLGHMRFLAFEALALFVMRGAATYGSLVVLSRIGNRIVATAQRRVFERLLNQNIAYFQDRNSGLCARPCHCDRARVRDGGARPQNGARGSDRPSRRGVLHQPNSQARPRIGKPLVRRLAQDRAAE